MKNLLISFPILTSFLITVSLTSCKSQTDAESPQASASPNAKDSNTESHKLVRKHNDAGAKVVSLSAHELGGRDQGTIALTEAEANWLKNNGYLTRKEIENLKYEDATRLLQSARENGDKKARIKLGVKELQERGYRRATMDLDIAARNGSLFALEELAFAELARAREMIPSSDKTSLMAAEARFLARIEQAKELGDHRADKYIEVANLSTNQDQLKPLAVAQAQEYMRQYNLDLTVKGERRYPSVRPNLEAWKEINASRPAILMVYEN